MTAFLRILVCCAFVLFLGCKENPKNEEKNGETIEMTVEETKSSATSSEPASDCDEFIDEYEDWMDSYLALLEKHKDNPAALAGTKEYNDMTMKYIEWASQGSKLAIDCATNSSYGERMKEIQDKADKKLKELGF